MILQGTYEFRTPKERLWEFIIDPAKIGRCLPDLKSLEVESEEVFVARIRVGVGLIKADFKFRIEIIGKEEPSRVRLKAVGTGSGNSINLDVAIELKEIPGGSELLHRTDVKVGGMMAGLGQRVIRDTADKTVAGVFERVKKHVE
jgi:carbon monoxide dehydrogenase subunit G